MIHIGKLEKIEKETLTETFLSLFKIQLREEPIKVAFTPKVLEDFPTLFADDLVLWKIDSFFSFKYFNMVKRLSKYRIVVFYTDDETLIVEKNNIHEDKGFKAPKHDILFKIWMNIKNFNRPKYTEVEQTIIEMTSEKTLAQLKVQLKEDRFKNTIETIFSFMDVQLTSNKQQLLQKLMYVLYLQKSSDANLLYEYTSTREEHIFQVDTLIAILKKTLSIDINKDDILKDVELEVTPVDKLDRLAYGDEINESL